MNMIQILKRTTVALTSMLMAAAVVGCSEDAPDYASVKDSSGSKVKSIEVGAAAETHFLSVGASGSWKAVSDDVFCYFPKSGNTSISGNIGDKLEVLVTENTTGAARIANLTITSGDASYNIKVNQAAYDGYITLNADYGEVAYDATSASFAYTTNYASVSISKSADWVTSTAETLTGTVALTFEENETYETRVAEITLASSDVTATYVLVQGGRDAGTLSLSDVAYTFNASKYDATTNPQSKEVTISSNIAGATYKVVSNEDWCSVDYAGGDTFTVTVAEDNATASSRTATITVSALGSSAETVAMSTTMTIVQECDGAPTLTVNSNAVSASQTGGDYTVTCYADGVVTDAANVDWITDVAVVNNIITIKVAENTSSDSREGVVTIACVSGGKVTMQYITVTQAGLGELELILSAASVEAAAAGEQVTIVGYSNTAGATISYLAPSASWCSGADGVYTLTANTSLISRECTVVVMVTAGEETLVKFVTITQKGADATI